MGIKALLLLPAILAFPGYLHGVAALPGTLPGPDTLYRDSTYLRVINEGSTRLNCYLSYPQGGWRVESTYGSNSSELARLARFIRTSLSDSLIYVREITLTGYCSIEGSYAHNERLARRRANGFRNYLDSVFGLSRRYPVRTSYVGEDWERLRSLADSCASLPSRREVLEIIDNTGIFDGRERKLMALHGGVPYNFMLSELFPLLRRVEILVEYDLHRIIEERYRRKLSASELQEILAHERAVAAAEQERLAELRRLAAESRQRAEQLRLHIPHKLRHSGAIRRVQGMFKLVQQDLKSVFHAVKHTAEPAAQPAAQGQQVCLALLFLHGKRLPLSFCHAAQLLKHSFKKLSVGKHTVLRAAAPQAERPVRIGAAPCHAGG